MWCSDLRHAVDRLWANVEGRYRVDTAKNAPLEASTVHTRALMDFLCDAVMAWSVRLLR